MADSLQDIFIARPGTTQEFGKQSALSGNDRPTIDDDLELPRPALLEFDGSSQSIADQSSETRCFLGDCASGFTVNDSDIHNALSPVQTTLFSATSWVGADR